MGREYDCAYEECGVHGSGAGRQRLDGNIPFWVYNWGDFKTKETLNIGPYVPGSYGVTSEVLCKVKFCTDADEN